MDLDLDTIYRENYPRVYSICLRMLRNEADAEDLAQDVFVQVSRKLDSFRGDSALTTWLHRVAVNQVLMFLRKKRHTTGLEVSAEEDFVKAKLEDLVSVRETSPIDRIAIVEMLKGLPRGYRKHLLMHDLFDYYHEEAADIFGTS